MMIKMIAVALGMAGMTMSSANALSDPHASDRLPKSEASGTLGFSKIGAWTPMLDENNVEVLSNEQLESRNLVKLASGKLYPIVKDEDGFVSGLKVVWNSIETSDDGNKIVVDWFESYGGPATMLWSDTYNMYIQPQYEGNWVDGNNPFGQFVHYYMAFEPTEELKVYTIVGAKSDVLKTEWTATLEVPEANGESLCVCKAAWEFEGGSYAGCTTTPDTSVPNDDTWCYTTMECEGATESSVVPGTYWILCDPTDGPSTTGYHHHTTSPWAGGDTTTGVPTATEETGGPGTGETAGTSSVASVALSSVAVAAIAWM